MRAGLLRHRVTIQNLTTAQDSFGDIVETWSDFATVWAQVEDLSGREFFAAAQVNSEIKTRVRIRYMEGIKPTMRILHGTRTLEIISPPIDPDGKRRILELLCREV